MTTESAIAVLAVGVLVAIYGIFRTLRRIVHFFDAVEVAAANHNLAMALIIHEFSSDADRVEEPITDLPSAKKATIKGLQLDMRASLHAIRCGQQHHDAEANARADRIIAAVKGGG